MPMDYADQDDVLAHLKLDPDNPDHADQIARVVRLENGIARAIEEKTGRVFGLTPVAVARVVLGSVWSPRLVLHTGVRSVTSVEIDGEWDGTAWQDGTVLEATDYVLAAVDRDGVAWALDRIDGGGWPASVRVTAVWGDQEVEDIPEDIREAATFLTVDEYRTREGSSTGVIGPDGMVVHTRNPWRFELVKTAIERHTVVEVLV